MILYLLENALTDFFSNFAHKLSRLSSLNPESFVAKCLTRFRDNRRYPKRSALRHRCYGNRLKRWSSMMEIEASLPYDKLI